ncbi:MAG: 3-deoxy-8-phosphooctulonate synthase [Sedimentisphaerales bacterium]|nr:3-deoxy-8-phosphooctulonate synthase [Sedimentisphaerales bacterium]
MKISNIKIEPDSGLFVIAGPCVIETEPICLDIASRLSQISKKTGIDIIFKASFDKANRSSLDSYRGPGIERGLEILAKVKKVTSLAVITDVHEVYQAIEAAQVVDCLQVPAFLCRQTDLLLACGKTGLPVNVKKGQFISPAEMGNVVEKIRSTGNDNILLTERGTFFGYNRLVNDMTAIPAMKQLGCPVVFDATHSTQQPGGEGNQSGGTRDMAPVLAKAAIAAGADGLFIEVHTDVEKSKSDSTSIMPIEWVEKLLTDCKKIREIIGK